MPITAAINDSSKKTGVLGPVLPDAVPQDLSLFCPCLLPPQWETTGNDGKQRDGAKLL